VRKHLVLGGEGSLHLTDGVGGGSNLTVEVVSLLGGREKSRPQILDLDHLLPLCFSSGIASLLGLRTLRREVLHLSLEGFEFGIELLDVGSNLRLVAEDGLKDRNMEGVSSEDSLFAAETGTKRRVSKQD